MLGQKLRTVRRQRNLTLRDVACKVAVSEGHLSKVENGKVVPSLTVLHRLAGVLGLNLARLFDEPQPGDRVVSRPGTRPSLALEGIRTGRGIVLEQIIAQSGDHVLECNIHIIEPQGGSDGQISHEGEEVGLVLEGEIDLQLDGKTYRLRAGDAFHFESHRPHGYRNVGPVRARVFWVNTPPTF